MRVGLGQFLQARTELADHVTGRIRAVLAVPPYAGSCDHLRRRVTLRGARCWYRWSLLLEHDDDREVEVDDFWMDEHPVTVGAFRRFVKATGYVTTAERPPESAD